jgi:type I restriction enzyme R subunit
MAPLNLDVRMSARDTKKGQRVKITGLDVQLVDESYEERDAEGNLVSPEDYLAKVREAIVALAPTLDDLKRSWIDRASREDLLQFLEDGMVHVDVLREILGLPDADSFDILAAVAFDEEAHTCEERAAALNNLHQAFFDRYSPEAQGVLRILVEKYRYAGLLEVSDPRIFTLAPFNSHVSTVAKRFGGIEELRRAMDELVTLLYRGEKA